jgi:hypothetical protein
MLERGFFPEFDIQTVLRLRDVAANIGKAYFAKATRSKEAGDKRYLAAVAGTYFRRSAANSLLLGDHRTSSKLFRDSARAYRSIGMPYSVMMKALAGERRLDSTWSQETDSPQAVFPLMQAILRRNQPPERLQAWRHHLEEFRGARLGIFAFQIDLYLDLIDALQVHDWKSPRYLTQVQGALLPFVETYSQALGRARRDKFHWKRLMMPFHPVEPDIVSVVVLTAQAITRHRLSPRSLLAGLPLRDDAYDVLEYCMRTIGRRPKRKEGD